MHGTLSALPCPALPCPAGARCTCVKGRGCAARRVRLIAAVLKDDDDDDDDDNDDDNNDDNDDDEEEEKEKEKEKETAVFFLHNG